MYGFPDRFEIPPDSAVLAEQRGKFTLGCLQATGFPIQRTVL